MTNNQPTTRGAELEQRLRRGIQMAGRALQPGARDLAVLTGVTKNCVFFEPQENVIAKLSSILLGTRRIFRYGNNIVYEQRNGNNHKLVNLATGHMMENSAVSRLANLVTCEVANPKNGQTLQFAPPRDLVQMVVNNEPMLNRLPTISTYALRALFDKNYRLCGPGWHEASGYLIHGDEIDPVLPALATDTGRIASPLPPLLGELLSDFPFKSAADRVNAVGALLTGLLANLFISCGKPLFVLDGNQPSVGKTLFARVLGVVCDGKEPSPIKYTQNDDEMEKKICSSLRTRSSSILLFDNAKLGKNAKIESAPIELNCTSSVISIRILGSSLNYEQPNDVLWVLTMNGTLLGDDLTARHFAIRLHIDGDPNGRNVERRDLISFALNNRNEILGELAGMVIYWHQQGQRPGVQTHRLGEWATTIGGILEANHQYGFLENQDEANAEFNSQLNDLASLAETAVQELLAGDQTLVRTVNDVTVMGPPADRGLPAGRLVVLYNRAGVLQDKLSESKPEKSKANIIARHLSGSIDREVEIDIQPRHGHGRGARGKAILHARPMRGNQKLYYFDFIPTPDDDTPPEAGSVTAPQDPSNPSPPPVAFQPPTQCPVPATSPVGGGNDLTWR